MMGENEIELLSKCFPDAGPVAPHVAFRNGRFSLTDRKACDSERRNQDCPGECDREILLIDAEEPLTVVSFDEWLHDDGRSKPDFILFDAGDNKLQFAFCELSCSLKRYVDSYDGFSGKRAKACSQMMNAWKSFADNDNPVFKIQILNFVSKIGIFGWRDRGDQRVSAAMRSANIFLNTPGSGAGIKKFEDYAFGERFDFIQVKYPAVFPWPR